MLESPKGPKRCGGWTTLLTLLVFSRVLPCSWHAFACLCFLGLSFFGTHVCSHAKGFLFFIHGSGSNLKLATLILNPGGSLGFRSQRTARFWQGAHDYDLLPWMVANPFRTTLKPWDTTVRWHIPGESPFQGFLNGAGFRPSRVLWLLSCCISGGD